MKGLSVSKYNRQTPCIWPGIKVMFHGIPKNASTSIKNILYEADNGVPFPGNKQWIHKGNAKGGSIYPPVDNIASYTEYTHFTVVRNPYDRFISFYSDLFLGSTNIRNNVPPFYTDNGIPLHPTPIESVVDIVCEFDDKNADEHFASQSSFIHIDDITFLKMENLEAEWKEFTEKINIAYKPLPVYNKSNSEVQLTERQKEKLYHRYKNDFEKFNYGR